MSEMRGGNAFDGGGSEQFFTAQGGNGALDVGPTGVLSEDGADDDLEAGLAGPPELRAMSAEQSVIVKRDVTGGRRLVRSGMRWGST